MEPSPVYGRNDLPAKRPVGKMAISRHPEADYGFKGGRVKCRSALSELE